MRKRHKKTRIKTQSKAPAPQLMTVLGFLLLGSVLPLYGELPLNLTLYLTVLFGVHLLVQRHSRLRPGRFVILVLTFVSVWMVFRQFHTLFGYQAGVALLAVMLALKLLETRSERDFYIAVILGLFFLVTQFLLNQSMYLALYALLIILGLLAVLIRYNRCASASMPYLLRLSGVLLVQSVPLVAIMFLLFPRLNAPLWGLKLDLTQGITGLSDSMAPGSVNKLIRSQETAFRAEFFGPPPDRDMLYWRGPIFWKTDGYRWFGNGGNELLETNEDPVESRGEGVYSYRLILEPHGKRWILALDLPVEAPRGSRLTADYQLLNDKPVNQRRQYLVTSVTSMRTTEITDAERTAALQSPARVSTRMLALVKDWQARARTQKDIVRYALHFFNKEPFVYTLTPPRLYGDTTDQFLFETRAGFCEHYASAFSQLMRIAGVPSRVVTGYLGGEYNALGNYFIVSQSDAHAWSEIWLAGEGWVRVDPTAAIAPERIIKQILYEDAADGAPVNFRLDKSGSINAMIRRIRLSLDALNTQWHIWVLGYNTGRQAQLLSWLGLSHWGMYGASGLMLLVLVLFLGVFAHLMIRKKTSRKDRVTGSYNLFCRRLSALGIQRSRHEGPEDFAVRATRMRPDLGADIKIISSLYSRLRFSGRGTPDQIEKLEDGVRRFRPGKAREKA